MFAGSIHVLQYASYQSDTTGGMLLHGTYCMIIGTIPPYTKLIHTFESDRRPWDQSHQWQVNTCTSWTYHQNYHKSSWLLNVIPLLFVFISIISLNLNFQYHASCFKKNIGCWLETIKQTKRGTVGTEIGSKFARYWKPKIDSWSTWCGRTCVIAPKRLDWVECFHSQPWLSLFPHASLSSVTVILIM